MSELYNGLGDTVVKDTRSHNVGASDYAKRKIQPWDIWLEYKLDPWMADIIKRVLRRKKDDDFVLDMQKIRHIVAEIIDQCESGKRDSHTGKLI